MPQVITQQVRNEAALAQEMYEHYADHAKWLTFDGRPMPAWGDLNDAVRSHWGAAARCAMVALTANLELTHAEMALVRLGQTVAEEFADAPVIGANMHKLIAKLASVIKLREAK